MGLTIKLLGAIEIQNEDGGDSELLKWSKGTALLTYLIVANQTQSREHLADLLWDSISTSHSLQNLRKLLSRIRKWVPELDISRKQVGLNLLPDTTIDYIALESGLISGEPSDLERLLPLYRGVLCEGFYLADAPRFNEWLLVEREQLRFRVENAFRGLCQSYIQEKNWADGVNLARRWFALGELNINEEALQYLLQFMGENGQVSEALQTYDYFKQRLFEELGVEPEQSTVQLVQQLLERQQTQTSWDLEQIKGHEPMRWPEGDTLAELGLLPTLSFIPYQRNSDFTGRRESLLHLAAHLNPELYTDRPSSKAVAITGTGGIGKTQLAVEFCYRYGRFFPGGVFWMNFDDPDSVQDEVAAIGGSRSMGLFHDEEKLSLAEKVGRVQKAWQAPIPRLLIFDNCEDEKLLDEWMPVSGGCSILITSRREIWDPMFGVHVWPLSPLDRDESVTLLQKMLGTLDQTAAEEIAVEFADLPLALYMAGSFLNRYRQFTPAEYIQQLRATGVVSHPSLVGREGAFSPTGHELDIARTFSVNFTQLDSADPIDVMAKKLLGCIVSFAHGETIPQKFLMNCVFEDLGDMMNVMAASDGLNRLATLGLVRFIGREGVEIHRLVAECAIKPLEEQIRWGSIAVAKQISSRFNEQYNQSLYINQSPVATVHINAVIRNVVSIDPDVGTTLMKWWGRYLRDVGKREEAAALLQNAADIRRNLSSEGDLELAEILSVSGTLAWEIGMVDHAWPFYEETIEIREKALGRNHPLTAQAYHNLGILNSRSGNFSEAVTLYERALSIYQAIDPPDEKQSAHTLYNLGILAKRMNDFDGAAIYYLRSLELRQAIFDSNNPYIAQSFSSLGYLLYQKGDYQEALFYHEQALKIRLASLGESHPHTTGSYLNMGVSLDGVGDFVAGEAFLRKAYQIIKGTVKLPSAHHFQNALNFGKHYLELGQYEEAAEFLIEAREHALAVRPVSEESGQTMAYLGWCAVAEGESDLARRYFDESAAIFKQIFSPDHYVTGILLIGEGKLALHRSKREEARKYFEKAIELISAVALPTQMDLVRAKRLLAELEK